MTKGQILEMLAANSFSSLRQSVYPYRLQLVKMVYGPIRNMAAAN